MFVLTQTLHMIGFYAILLTLIYVSNSDASGKSLEVLPVIRESNSEGPPPSDFAWSEELMDIIDKQFRYQSLYKSTRKTTSIPCPYRLADEHIAKDSLEASFMVHDSLFSYVSSVRCPMYAVVFRWFQKNQGDATESNSIKRNLDKANLSKHAEAGSKQHDQVVEKIMTRHYVQLLSYIVTYEQAFFHDEFLISKFWSVADMFINVAQQIELEAIHAAQTETWFDLVGCLYEYGAMPTKNEAQRNTKANLDTFLNHEARKRLAEHMVALRGKHDRSLSGYNLERLRNIKWAQELRQSSRAAIGAMMDPDLQASLSRYKKLTCFVRKPQPATKPSYPMWPLSTQSTMAYDPARHFQPLPVQINRYSNNVVTTILKTCNNRPDDWKFPAWMNSAQVGRIDMLKDIAMYYRVRLILNKWFEDSDDNRDLSWSKLPLSSTLEYMTILKGWPKIGTAAGFEDMNQDMSDGFKLSSSLGDQFELIENSAVADPIRYKHILNSMKEYTSELDLEFDVNLIDNLVDKLSNFIKLVESVKNLVQSKSDHEEDHNGDDSGLEMSDNEPEEKCSVCLDDIYKYRGQSRMCTSDHQPTELKCSHNFKLDCLHEWLGMNPDKIRPLCKS